MTTNEEKKEKLEKLKKCQDCDNNVYNHGLGGAKECWSLQDAKPCRIFVVGTWQQFPEKHMKPINRLNCWIPIRGSNISIMKREL